jgi:acetolactate synthase-1/3 small subunit
MHHVLIATLDDEPGVLERVAATCRKRAFNIHSLTVSPSVEPGESRLTLVVDTDGPGLRRVQANLERLLNVRTVACLGVTRSVVRDLLLVRVSAVGLQRPQVLQLAQVFRAQVVDLAEDSLVLECTGGLDKLDRFVEVLRPFGVLELGRSGAVAMHRGDTIPLTFVPRFPLLQSV